MRIVAVVFVTVEKTVLVAVTVTGGRSPAVPAAPRRYPTDAPIAKKTSIATTVHLFESSGSPLLLRDSIERFSSERQTGKQ